MAYHYARFGAEIVLTARREAVLQKVRTCLYERRHKRFGFHQNNHKLVVQEDQFSFRTVEQNQLRYVWNSFHFCRKMEHASDTFWAWFAGSGPCSSRNWSPGWATLCGHTPVPVAICPVFLTRRQWNCVLGRCRLERSWTIQQNAHALPERFTAWTFTQGNDRKLCQGKFRLHMRKTFLTERFQWSVTGTGSPGRSGHGPKAVRVQGASNVLSDMV